MSKQGKEKGKFQNKCISALLREALAKIYNGHMCF